MAASFASATFLAFLLSRYFRTKMFCANPGDQLVMIRYVIDRGSNEMDLPEVLKAQGKQERRKRAKERRVE